MKALLLGSIVLLTGCSSTNISEVIKAMANDPATVCATAVVAGSTINIARTNITEGEVSCNGNGLAVKSSPTATQVPVKVVVPQ